MLQEKSQAQVLPLIYHTARHECTCICACQYISVLRCGAVKIRLLQYAAWCVAVRCSKHQVALCCSKNQCVVVLSNILDSGAETIRLLQYAARCLRCVAVEISVLWCWSTSWTSPRAARPCAYLHKCAIWLIHTCDMTHSYVRMRWPQRVEVIQHIIDLCTWDRSIVCCI